MAPKAEKKPAKKVAKTAKTGGKKKSKAKVESFKIYIYKVLKQVRQPSPIWLLARCS
jgi:histone H2B